MFHSLPLLAALCITGAGIVDARFVMYYDQWHPDRPTSPTDRLGIDHLVLAFAQANNTGAFQPVIPMETARQEYKNAKIMIALGGWGDTMGFSQAIANTEATEQFARNVATLLDSTGADGIDIDWEYPGGNGADYKSNPNAGKSGEIAAFPGFLASLRRAIGTERLLSIAVPGKEVDMLAYTAETGPSIWREVDFVNVMSYDLMNRRDNATAHHTSIRGALASVQRYLSIGLPASKCNLGFAYYAKWFTTAGSCGSEPLGCPIVPAEDPETGADAGTSGAWTFEKAHLNPIDKSMITTSMDGTCGPEKMQRCSNGCCGQYGYCGTTKEHCGGGCQHAFGSGCTGPDVAGSWQRAAANGVQDTEAGAEYYYDDQERLFWTWDTPEIVAQKFDQIVRKLGLGGVMAWSLGEDSFDWGHIRAMAKGWDDYAESGGYGKAAPEVSTSPGQSNTTGPSLDTQSEQTYESDDGPEEAQPSDEAEPLGNDTDDSYNDTAYQNSNAPSTEPETWSLDTDSPRLAGVEKKVEGPEILTGDGDGDGDGDADADADADGLDWAWDDDDMQGNWGD